MSRRSTVMRAHGARYEDGQIRRDPEGPVYDPRPNRQRSRQGAVRAAITASARLYS